MYPHVVFQVEFSLVRGITHVALVFAHRCVRQLHVVTQVLRTLQSLDKIGYQKFHAVLNIISNKKFFSTFACEAMFEIVICSKMSPFTKLDAS